MIFLQTTDIVATAKTFVDFWFGGRAPAGLTFGSYTGSGIGSSGGGIDGAFTVPGSTGNSETGSPGYIAPSRIVGGAGNAVLNGTVLAGLMMGGAGNDTLSGTDARPHQSRRFPPVAPRPLRDRADIAGRTVAPFIPGTCASRVRGAVPSIRNWIRTLRCGSPSGMGGRCGRDMVPMI